MWGWGLANIEKTEVLEDVEVGTDMDSFSDRIASINSIVYFHNFAFDGAFIVDYLLRAGFRYVPEHPRAGEFSTLISNMGAWYSMTVKWENGKKTEFRDSLKKLPMPVKRVAESFNLPVAKGEIDYRADRPVGHVITEEEAHYIRLDVFIIAQALKVQFASGMKKLTVGADSLAEYKRITGPIIFSKMFPILNETMDAEIRTAYRGGWTYADVRFRNRETRSGIVYDVNSLYPSVMYDRVLPHGDPLWVDDLPVATEDYPLFLVSITFTAKLKPNHVPCIQVKGSTHFISTEYQTEIKDPVTLMCTNVDLELWKEHYDMDIYSYNGGWLFEGAQGLFTEYIDKWMKIKISNKGGLKEIAKLHLNSLYGKFATNPNVTGKYPVMEDNVVRLKEGPEETRNPVYTAMGVFITSYARDVTIRAAQENYDTFAYADTDSLHLLVDEDPPTLDIDPDKLGAWKREYRFMSAVYLRAKQYAELKEDGKYEVHIAGLPRTIAATVTFDDLLKGRTFEGKLMPKRVPGGIVLVDTTFHFPGVAR